MKHFKFALICVLFIFNINVQSQTKEDSVAIINVAKSYVEAWYDGDAVKMKNTLHPMMSKKSKNGDILSLESLLELTKNCVGCNPSERVINIEILDFFNVTTPEGSAIFNYATVKCESNQYIDYFHISQTYGEWKIGNILWDYKINVSNGTEADLIATIQNYHHALKTKDTVLLESVLMNTFRSGKAMCYFLIESVDLPWLIENRDNFIEGFSTSDSIKIEVQDIHMGNIAMAKVTAGDKTELFQITYINNSWKLVNGYRNYYTKLRDFSITSTEVPSNALSDALVAGFETRLNYNPDVTYSLAVESSDAINNENFKIVNKELHLKINASDIINWPQTISVKAVSVFGDTLIQDFSITKEITSSIPQSNGKNTGQNMQVSPNPASHIFTVKLKAPQLGKLKLHDLNGKVLAGIDLVSEQETTMDISGLDPGNYLVSYSSGTYSETVKLIKQ